MKRILTEEQKEAKKLYQIEYRKKNKEKFIIYAERQKEYRKEYRKKDYEKNKEEHKKKRLKYYHDNREERLVKMSEYKKKNRDKMSAYQREYFNNRKKIDPLFKLQNNIRGLIRNSIINKGYRKNTKTFNILGCTYIEFKKHIESMFEDWMTWDNYGKYNGSEKFGWDVDHIIPKSSATTEEELLKLNHFSNLQPLCSYINRDVKKNKLL